MSSTGTMRGNNPSRSGGRGPMPSFINSPAEPASGIPRSIQRTDSEVGSSLTSGRQKQQKKDEVCHRSFHVPSASTH